MTNQTKKMTLARLQKEARFLHIALPFDSREDRPLLEFSNSPAKGLEKKDNDLVPMLDKKTMLFTLTIDLKERNVLNWNRKYGYWRIWGKVKNYGTYTLLNSDKVPLWQIHGLVPNKLVPPFEQGWGDYLDIKVNSDGRVENWPKEGDYSVFIENGRPPKELRSNRWHLVSNAIYRLSLMKLDMEELSMLKLALFDSEIIKMIVEETQKIKP